MEEFSDVATRVAPRLYRIATRMCGHPQDAEDLVQETLLQGFRKWSQFEGRSDPATWLYTIAGRLCRRRHRRRAGEPARIESLSDLLPSHRDPVSVLPSAANSPADAQISRDAERIVARALATLPIAFRLPLVLADIAELTTAEVALILGLKEATVKTRVHRARLRVRRALIAHLPRRDAPAPNHDRQVCLDLLRAKQESLDRRVPFPYSNEELCDRCRTVFGTLDLGRAACAAMGSGTLPPRIKALLAPASPGR